MMTKIKQKFVVALLLIVLTASAITVVTLNKTAVAASSDYMDLPQITVLTHGLGGSAKHWTSLDGSGEVFAQDYDSLVEKLSAKAGGAYIYRAETTSTDGNNPSYSFYENYGDTETLINNVSKHIIIIFDSASSGKSNEVVYNEFKNMLNDAIGSVKYLNTGRKNPKVNLIGHSRGGITNLQYALEFPENVHSMISLGTPYFGSDAAASFGAIIMGALATDGLNSIIDSEKYDKYYQTWTDGYEEKYKNINSIAIGGTATVSYQRDVLSWVGSGTAEALASLLFCFENSVFQVISVPILQQLYPTLVKQYSALGMFTQAQFVELVLLINSEVHFGAWYSDVFVPIDSQQGFKGDKNYNFTKFVKHFNHENASQFPKRSVDNLPILHNLETYDADIHNYILKNIIMKSGNTIDNEISNVGKNGNSWVIKIRNTHSTGRSYAYNTKMCSSGDAQNWSTGLNDIATFWLEAGETKIVTIAGNGTATSIVVSSTSGSMRYIKYADNLWNTYNVYKMTAHSSTKFFNNYTLNGMKVGITGKNGNRWIIELTNSTGSTRSFDYNYMMCNSGDAQNWTGLSHVTSTGDLANAVSTQIEIQENGFATSIAICYIIGETRYILYAKDLNEESGTMTAQGNSKPATDPPSCVAEGTLITLADGSQKAVENLTGDEMLLVWNMITGTFDAAPILFVDSDPEKIYEVIYLYFNDGSVVKVISEHAFWDLTLNEYVYLDTDAADYIGHWFSKQDTKNNGNIVDRKTKLVDVVIEQEMTTAWSPITYGHLCYYVNGMLSMPGGITGLINILEVNPKTMTIDQDALLADIETYGLFSYEEFAEILPVPEVIFEAFNGQYLKIAIGKGLVDFETLGSLVERYSEFF